MRLRRVYIRVGLGGLAFLVLMTAVLLLLGAVASWGFFVLTFYWIALCLIVGLIPAFVSALRRRANRSVNPS